MAAAAGIGRWRRLTAAALHGGRPGPTLARLQQLAWCRASPVRTLSSRRFGRSGASPTGR
ncbi:hypothetical protein ACSNN9_00170 [Micromonospora sp. URMC 107]|uniref:hypothetical protein n=1 Tax=Micromonospora sp. URMC 107 TaxID=3423418 RepID=UPI003F1B3114